MVLFSLEIKCTLENIDVLYPGKNFSYNLKVKCTSCGEESQNWHSIDESEEYECKGGHGKVHFRYKCKLCSRENVLRVVADSKKKTTSETCERFGSIVTLDCRGLEPIAFTPGNGWEVVAEGSNQVFDSVNLEENEWVDYDTSAKQTVGVYDFDSKFVRIK